VTYVTMNDLAILSFIKREYSIKVHSTTSLPAGQFDDSESKRPLSTISLQLNVCIHVPVILTQV